jgi:SAM-dependent methyltransferase
MTMTTANSSSDPGAGGDGATLDAYDRAAPAFADDWAAQPAPSDMYDTLRRFFRPGPTADIGCGSGRDAAWLAGNGYPATGYDASEGLLAEARRRHPGVPFHRAALPTLAGVGDTAFENVLCETVIMHLPATEITPSVQRLLAILRPGGTLYLSWRLTAGSDLRDPHGRLYAAFDADLVLAALAQTEILLDEQPISLSSGKAIRRIVARK